MGSDERIRFVNCWRERSGKCFSFDSWSAIILNYRYTSSCHVVNH